MGLDRIKDIKERVSVLEYARDVLGLPVRRSGDRCVSLAPGSTNPTALLIQTNHWYDFKLGMGGDVIDLCAYARHNGDKGAAIRELGGVDDGWLAYTQNLCNGVEKWHKDLREEDWKYLRSRGLTDDTVKRLKSASMGTAW